jgi:hypothetical protein
VAQHPDDRGGAASRWRGVLCAHPPVQREGAPCFFFFSFFGCCDFVNLSDHKTIVVIDIQYVHGFSLPLKHIFILFFFELFYYFLL